MCQPASQSGELQWRRRNRLPRWLKKRLPASNEGFFTHRLLTELSLSTVCEHARCPNLPECYSRRVATFMILGSRCTRNCGFCAVTSAKPEPVDWTEPVRVAQAAKRLGLRHVVITSVTRDDLPDGGAELFHATVVQVRKLTGATVEVLTPDFQGNWQALERVLAAGPDVFNHNIETVPRLYRRVRPKADYRRSLLLLRRAKQARPGMPTKSGLMVGLGETFEEVLEVLADLRDVECDMVTIGQYLSPSPRHLPVQRYWRPEEFERLRQLAQSMGFRAVACGPFVRSSYRASELLHANVTGQADGNCEFSSTRLPRLLACVWGS